MKEIIERDEEKNTCLVARCENCGRLHVYKEKEKMEKDVCVAVADQCECWGMQSYMKTRHQM